MKAQETYPIRDLAKAGSENMDGPRVILKAEFAGEDHEWTGSIVRTEGELDPKSRMVTVVARVEDPYGRNDGKGRPPLAVGLFVQAEISGKFIPEAMVIPRSALHPDDRVLVLDNENRLHYRSIQVLRTERESVIVEGGLEAGEKVVVSPLAAAIEGMAVRVSDEDPKLGGSESS